MGIRNLKFELGDSGSDGKVLAHIRSENPDSYLLSSFFEDARRYAQSYLSKKYPDLAPFEWDVVFANTNLKFITRVKKGLTLNENIQLTTYYTSVAKFATLDFIQDRRSKQQFLEVEENQVFEFPDVEQKLDKDERAEEIKDWLFRIIENEDQVMVMLLQARGFSYQEIVQQTNYRSEGACRNALLKGKKKVSEYLLKNPETIGKLRRLIQGN